MKAILLPLRAALLLLCLLASLPALATDYDTTIVVNSSADTIGLSQLKSYKPGGWYNKKYNRICVKNSEKVFIDAKDLADFKSYDWGSGVSYDEEKQVIEVTSVGICYFHYYTLDGNDWRVFMDVNRFGVLQYRGADAPDTLYVEEAELEDSVYVPDGAFTGITWYGLKDGQSVLINSIVPRRTTSAKLSTLLSSGYTSFITKFIDGTQNDLPDGTTAGLNRDTLTIIRTDVVEVTAEDGGTASGGGHYAKNEEVTVSATPDYGYRFAGWKDEDGNIVSTDTNYTFVFTGRVSLTATFEERTFTVAFSAAEGEGTVTCEGTWYVLSNPETTALSSGDEVPFYSWLTFTATPADGYKFSSWTLNGEELPQTYPSTFTFSPREWDFDTDDVVVTASFAKTTGISGVATDKSVNAIYTTTGVRVNGTARLPRGIYVRNGSKFVVK